MGNSFDNIIGYDAIKEELNQIVDIIQNLEVYEKYGVSIPKGVLLYVNTWGRSFCVSERAGVPQQRA